MSELRYELPQIGQVIIQKRRTSRNLKLRITADGDIRVSQPAYLPYRVGKQFVISRLKWLSEQLVNLPTKSLLEPGQQIGKNHYLYFLVSHNSRISTRLVGKKVCVFLPSELSYRDSLAQEAARAVIERSLRRQTKQLIGQRLEKLASEHGYRYSLFKVRKLSSRWGSCDSQRRITINLFLVQLPWDLIDYVLLHELTHLNHLNHSPAFWQELTSLCPDARHRAGQIKHWQPTIYRSLDDVVN